jgi:hypothetical protein
LVQADADGLFALQGTGQPEPELPDRLLDQAQTRRGTHALVVMPFLLESGVFLFTLI